MSKFPGNIKKFLGIKCSHNCTKSDSCNFCPDCGKKVITRWVSIKCRQCGQIREAKKSGLHSIKPEKSFCFNCGCSKWAYQYYYNLNIPDKLKEISVKQVVEDNENPFREKINHDIKIWVENPQYSNKKFHSNVIKAKKF